MVDPVNRRDGITVRLNIARKLRELVKPMEQQQIYVELNRLLSEPRLRRLYTKVKAAFKDRDPVAHNWEHVRRVVLNSIEVGLEEHADMSIVTPAVLLHDLGYITNPDEPSLHPTYGARECYRFLEEWSPEDRDLIAGCIRKHKGKYPGYADSEPETREEQVVCDADQIDKFGWVGFLQMIKVYTEHGMIGIERYKTIAGLVDGMLHQNSVSFYTDAAKRRGAELADPDFNEVARKVTAELSLYDGWKEEL